MLSKHSRKRVVSRELKESLLNEGGMTKQDFDKQMMESQVETAELQGLDVFTDPVARDLFKTLTQRVNVSTADESIINLWLSFDSQYVLALCQVSGEDEDCMELRAYDVETGSNVPVWTVEYKGSFLRLLTVEQNNEGKKFAMAYNDHGSFYVSIVDAQEGKEVALINVNRLLQIDKRSIPIDNIKYPMITCCFTASNSIFVSLYHRLQKKQYSFFYDISTQTVTQKQNCNIPQSSLINFSNRSFYNKELQECYTFYRQGQVVTVFQGSNEQPELQQMTNADLGDMYCAFDKALIVRSSSNFLIFKKEQIEEESEDGDGSTLVWRWVQIFKLKNMRGNIFFMRGNQRFQITTDEKIYVYIFKDKTTLIPELESVMYNFIQCSQMIIGSKVKYCVTYKKGQPDFSIFSRTQYHNFKVPIDNDNYEGAQGANLGKFNQYAITQRQVVNICNLRDFKEIQEFNVIEKGGIEDQDVRILYFTVSECQTRMGILLGKDMSRGEIQPTHLQIYENSTSKGKSWKKLISRKFDFPDACKQFLFDKNDNQVLFFFSDSQFIEYNYQSQSKKIRFQYPQKMQTRPHFGVLNSDQTCLIVTSPNDCLFMNTSTGKFVDLDDTEFIRSIENIYAYQDNFYILANKRNNELGFFLLKFDINQPDSPCSQLIAWNHMLDISDADIQFLGLRESELEDDIDEENDEQIEKSVTKNLKTLVVSFKMIGINTYNVFVIDLESHLIRYWHESYQLWESSVKGFLLKSKEFMILSKDGIQLIMLGNKNARQLLDKDGNKRTLHSLCEMNYLRIEPTNHIYFQFQDYNDRHICIQDQYQNVQGQTMFDDIFTIKIFEPTLRELLLYQSIYAAKKLSDISEIVQDQPNPSIFFKIFLELDLKCMTIHLAFDNRSIKRLLSRNNEKYFDEENPIFYPNKDRRTAIDIALDNNQIKSVDLMLDYIVRFQNKYVYANLFKYNLVTLIEQGVNVSALMDSKIINYSFDYIEWPTTSHITKKMFGSFNESVFRLRKKYKHIFPQLVDAKDRFDEDGNPIEIKGGLFKKVKSKAEEIEQGIEHTVIQEDEKEFKIEYQLNQLSSMSTEDGDIITAISQSEEVELFLQDAVVDLVDYRWNQWAFKFHFVNVSIHFIYCLYLFEYVKIIFIDHETVDASEIMEIHFTKDSERQLNNIGDPEYDDRIYPPTYTGMLVIQLMLLVPPIIIATTQFIRKGWAYWITPYYWIEILNIIFGLWSIYCQAYVGTWDITSKIVLILLIFISLIKTVFYLKIFKAFSYIVTMVISVITDLKYFVTFFIILITFFSMLFNVVNRNKSTEYGKLSWIIGNWLAVFRLSLGDFDFTLIESQPLTKTHILFWCIWLLMVIFTALIFLNFIIAEVSNSYTRVRENVFSYIYKERAKLISEAEELLSKKTKLRNKDMFPQYIIVRQLEDRIQSTGKKK